MGSPALIPKVQKDDWVNLNRVLRKLAFSALGPDSQPTLSGIQFNTNFEDGSAEGRLQWNSEDGTLEVGMPGGVVNLQIGQEMLIRVTNGTGGEIANGIPVYVSGASGANIIVGLADADFATGVGLRTVAVATEAIAAGKKGYVTTEGLVRDIDTSMFAAEGMPIYLAKGGGFATAPPTPPDITFVIGVVVRKHASEGVMLVLQTSLPNLNSLSDVFPSSLTDNDLLRWDAGDDRWENSSLVGTANRVTVTHGDGTITLSGPQDIHSGASVNFADLTLTTKLQVTSGGSASSPAVRVASDNTGLLADSTNIGLSLAGVNRLNYSSVGSSWAMTFPSSSLLFAHGAITSTSGQISFGDENLVTTGKLTAHSVTLLGGHIANIRTVNDSTYNIVTADWMVWADTSGNDVTVNLPASPEQGREVEVKCIDATNTCTVGRNGNNIDGVANDLSLVLNTNYVFVYDETYGWGIR